MKILIAVLIACLLITAHEASSSTRPPAEYKLPVCTSHVSSEDVIAVDHDHNGTEVLYKRNAKDIAALIDTLKKKIHDDPAIAQSKHWRPEMLTEEYWQLTACGGKDNCSTKSCSPGHACFYGNIGVAGCRCD